MLNEVIPAGVSGSLSSGGVLYPAFNSSNATNYEVTPYEWGSWTGRAQAFAALPYLGTPLDDGRPAANFSVEGYDTAAFIGGTALSASNLWILQNRSNGTGAPIRALRDAGLRPYSWSVRSAEPSRQSSRGVSPATSTRWF